MKKTIHLFIFAFALLAVSCTEKWPKPNFNIIPGNELIAPASGTAVDLKSDVKFEWKASEAEDGGYVSYEVLFDKSDGDFSAPLKEMASTGTGAKTNLTVKKADLTTIANAAGIDAGQTGTLKWTVRASKGVFGSIYEQVNELTVTVPAK